MVPDYDKDPHGHPGGLSIVGDYVTGAVVQQHPGCAAGQMQQHCEVYDKFTVLLSQPLHLTLWVSLYGSVCVTVRFGLKVCAPHLATNELISGGSLQM